MPTFLSPFYLSASRGLRLGHMTISPLIWEEGMLSVVLTPFGKKIMFYIIIYKANLN